MKIVDFDTADLEFLPALQPPDWTDITPHFKFYIDSSSCFPLKVRDGQQVIGVGTGIMHADTAWLAHIIVHPDHRNKGIGKVLTQALVDSVDRNRFKTIYLMATPMGEPVYNKLGFVFENEQFFFNGGNIEPQLAQPGGIIPYREYHREALLRMDREVSGESRVERLNGYLQDAFVYVSEEELQGYYMPGLGEGLIVATNTNAGILMMQYRLQAHTVAIVSTDNQAAVKLLSDNGFEVFRKAKRMRLGEIRPWQPQHIYNRISGQLG